jgi:3-oxoacyl-[acyl-carrier protein] reductase
VRLAERVALVTGSSRGIGAAIARRLAADGARVVVHGRTESEPLLAVAAEIGAAGVVVGELETADAPVRIVREAFAVHGALDILVCNAGGGGGGLVVDQELEVVDRILASNLRAVMLSVAEFARLTASEHGRVVFISSGAATHPAYGSSIYASAKAGAEAFIRSAAQELGERGITLNSVAPGTTRTDMVEGQTWPARVPRFAALRRIGEPEDIADIVAFLASDDARWLTGATLPANGGLITTAANIIAYVQDPP